VGLSIKNHNGVYKMDNAVDTTGYSVDLNIVLRDMTDVTTLTIQMRNKETNVVEDDTTCQLNGVPDFYYKIVKQFYLDKQGEKEIVVLATSPEHGTIAGRIQLTVIRKPFVNTAPEVTVSGIKSTPSNMSCTLTVSIRDDSGQTNSTVVVYRQQNYLPDAKSQFVFRPVSGFVGEDTVTFIVSDNYTPPLTTRKSVYIPVVAAALMPPDAPSGLRVTSQTVSAISLVWQQTVSALTYAVYRSASFDKNFTKLVDTLTSTAFTDKLNDTVWYYYITARNTVGESGKSNIVSTGKNGNPVFWKIDTLQTALYEGDSLKIPLKSLYSAGDDTISVSLLQPAFKSAAVNDSALIVRALNRDSSLQMIRILLSTKVNADTLYYLVKIEPRYLVVTIKADSGTLTLTPSLANYRWGDTLKISGVPKNGFVFYQWDGDIAGVTADTSIVVKKNIQASARFWPISSSVCDTVDKHDLRSAIIQYSSGAKRPAQLCPNSGAFDNGKMRLNGKVKFVFQK
jgi:hypothetical protein